MPNEKDPVNTWFQNQEREVRNSTPSLYLLELQSLQTMNVHFKESMETLFYESSKVMLPEKSNMLGFTFWKTWCTF